jgi:hypothetical protein
MEEKIKDEQRIRCKAFEYGATSRMTRSGVDRVREGWPLMDSILGVCRVCKGGIKRRRGCDYLMLFEEIE